MTLVIWLIFPIGIHFFVAISLCAADAPIVIQSGGTYTGTWTSTNPNIPAVTILTNEPVVITSSVIQGKGILISAPNNVPHKRLTIINSIGIADNPGIAGIAPGRFLKAEDISSLTVINNLLIGTSGIYIVSYSGNGTSGETITICCNRANNIDGRWSDGATSFQSGDGKCDLVQFCQLNQVRGISGAEIAWNWIENAPGASRVEDIINIYESGGSSSNHLRIHDNYIKGEYSYPPGSASYSGGGITAGDCSATTTITTAPAFIDVFKNHIVSFSNGGVGLVGGHDISIYNNRAISTGLTANGVFYPTKYGNGFVSWNAYALPSTIFFNNHVHDNLSGMIRDNGQGQRMRADYWLPALDEYAINNNMLADPQASDEAGELTLWLADLNAATLKNGPPLPICSIQPTSRDIAIGDSANFMAVASGIPTPSLQWQSILANGSTWTTIANANTASLTILNASSDLNGMRYRCTVTNLVGQTISTESTIHVHTASVNSSNDQGSSSSGGSSCGIGTSAVLFGVLGLTYRTSKRRKHLLPRKV